MRRSLALVVLTVCSIGCVPLVVDSTPSARPSTPSPTVAPSPTAAPPSSPTLTPEPAPSATPEPQSARERSDRFWDLVSDFDVASTHYDNLRDITLDAHLIIHGRLIDLRPGEITTFRGNGTRRTVFGVVAVDEVLKGEAATLTPGTIVVPDMGFDWMTKDDLDGGDVIMFLKNYALSREESGVRRSTDPNDAYYYPRPNFFQCVLRNFGGTIEIVDGPKNWEEHLGPFPSGLDGAQLSEVLERIRTIAGSE